MPMSFRVHKSAVYFVVGILLGLAVEYVVIFHYAKDSESNLTRDEKSVPLSKVRLLCWVMTTPSRLAIEATSIRDTWGRRCDVLLFASDHRDEAFPTINITVKHGRFHLTAKTVAAFDYVYRHHVADADWFLKTDDDTYVIVDNLRHLLATRNTNELVYFGHHYLGSGKQGYYSGGAGYVISRTALKAFGRRAPDVCEDDGIHEDVRFGKCMEKLGVRAADTRDSYGRSRFHPFSPGVHLTSTCPDWHYRRSKYPNNRTDSVSDAAISFHYIPPHEMYALDYLIYKLKLQ